MDPIDLAVLGAVTGGVVWLARRHPAPGPRRRPGGTVTSVGSTVGRAAGRATAVTGRAVASAAGWGVGTSAAVGAAGAGLLVDAAAAGIDGAARVALAVTRAPAAPGPAPATGVA